MNVRSPSMLDLIRLSPRRIFPPGGEDLYRQVARLTGLAPGMEVLDVACGKGISLDYFIREHGVQGTGVERDPRLITEAEAYFKAQGMREEVSFQEASSQDLPFRDETFDVVIGELGLAAQVDPEEAIRELVRVARPGGRVVLIQLVWKAPIDESRKGIIAAHLGAKPLMGVELRRTLLRAGVEELHTEDWTDEGTAFRSQVKKPFPDFAELFGLLEKLGILRRVWGRWGLRGVRTVIQREAEVHRLLTRQRILGLSLVVGVKTSSAKDAGGERGSEAAALRADETAAGAESDPRDEENLETAGLPLFSPENGRG